MCINNPFLLLRYERAQWVNVWSITTCGRSLSVTSILPNRPPGSAARNTACNQGACECCWDNKDMRHSLVKVDLFDTYVKRLLLRQNILDLWSTM